MAIEDDDKPRKKITHEIGQDLSLLSVEELTERIALMNSEIERLQQAVTRSARQRTPRTVFSRRRIFRTQSLTRSSLRTQGPIRRGPSLWQAAGRLSLNQIAGGYGSLRSQGRPAVGVNIKTRPLADMANNL